MNIFLILLAACIVIIVTLIWQITVDDIDAACRVDKPFYHEIDDQAHIRTDRKAQAAFNRGYNMALKRVEMINASLERDNSKKRDNENQ